MLAHLLAGLGPGALTLPAVDLKDLAKVSHGGEELSHETGHPRRGEENNDLEVGLVPSAAVEDGGKPSDLLLEGQDHELLLDVEVGLLRKR